MPRYERTYTGEHRTEVVTVKLTPSERRELEDAAKEQGAPKLSTFVRERLFRRVPTRRNPEAKAIIDTMNAAGRELQAVGNSLSTGNGRSGTSQRWIGYWLRLGLPDVSP